MPQWILPFHQTVITVWFSASVTDDSDGLTTHRPIKPVHYELLVFLAEPPFCAPGVCSNNRSMQQNEAKHFQSCRDLLLLLMSEAHSQERLRALHCLHLHSCNQMNSSIVRRAAGNGACEGRRPSELHSCCVQIVRSETEIGMKLGFRSYKWSWSDASFLCHWRHVYITKIMHDKTGSPNTDTVIPAQTHTIGWAALYIYIYITYINSLLSHLILILFLITLFVCVIVILHIYFSCIYLKQYYCFGIILRKHITPRST